MHGQKNIKIFLGALAELEKSDYWLLHLCLSLCLSVRLSIHPSAWNNSSPTGQNVVEFENAFLNWDPQILDATV